VIFKINRLVETARDVDIPVIWSKESHRHDGTDRGTELLWENATHTESDTWGENFHNQLAVNEESMNSGEYIVKKRRYNLFYGTDLMHLLNMFDTDTVILTGVTTSVCVQYTAQGALERDYVFRTVRECTAEKTIELHKAGLKCQDNIQSGGVQSFDQIIDKMEMYPGNDVVSNLKSDGKIP
jgi:nicotinamidase-related amidase